MTLDSEALINKVKPAEKILLVYGDKAPFGAVAMTLSVYLWLRAAGKQVMLVSPALPVVEFSSLVGINKVKSKLNGENLVITLPGAASKIDKVISDLDQAADRLSLIVKPKKPGDIGEIMSLPVHYQAPDYDLIWLIDVQSTSELETLGATGPAYWTSPERNLVWTDFATPAPVPAEWSVQLGKDDSFAAVWAQTCRQAGWMIDADQASNLLMALEQESDHFGAVSTSAEIFELAAWLLRQGAVRYRPDAQAIANFQPEHHLPQPPQMPQMVGITPAGGAG